jgi:transketolase
MATIEEHSIIGGLGGAVAEVLSELPGPKPQLLRIGLRDGFSCEVGDQEYLRQIYGLSPEGIAQRVYEALSRKKTEAKIYGVSD